MTLRWMPACFAAIAAVSFTAAVVASVATGCSSNDETPPPSPAPSQCATTLVAANGSACSEGLVCPYESTCGAFQQQTTCTCVNGALACVVDATDASLAPGADPTCTPQTNPAACPASEPHTNDTCTAVGLTCLYKDLVCPRSDGGANIDTCECQGGINGGLVYECAIAECLSSGDGGVGTPLDGNVPDQGAPDAADAGGDASVDSSSDDSG